MNERVRRYFAYDHLREPLRSISEACCNLADEMIEKLPDNNAEVTVGLRKLLEAKDCFVRAALDV